MTAMRTCNDCNNRFSDWPGNSCPWCLRGMEITRLREALRPYARGAHSDCCEPDESRCGDCSRCNARAAVGNSSVCK